MCGLLESGSTCQIQSEKQWEHYRVKPVFNHKVPNLIGVDIKRSHRRVAGKGREAEREKIKIRHGKADVDPSSVCVLGFGVL